jgi:GNAT superfamily N-acetyltransferase
MSNYRLSEDPAELDLNRVVQLIRATYWGKDRPREVIERSFANSSAAGIYTSDGEQVAVARIVSDETTFAWLCDVFVSPSHRGRGLGTILAEWAAGWGVRHGVKRVLLSTLDAHGMYEKVGFKPLAHPERWMEIDTRPPTG